MAGWVPSNPNGCHQQNDSYVSTNQPKVSTGLLRCCGFLEDAQPNCKSSVSHDPEKNDFKWGPEQRQAFEHIKWKIVHAVALGPVWSGQDVKNVLYTAAGENGPTWSLWQTEPGET